MNIPGIITPNLSVSLTGGVEDKLITPRASAKMLQMSNHSFIQGTMGPDPSALNSTRVIISGVAVDDSGSMHLHRDAEIAAINHMISKIQRSTELASVLMNLMAIRSTPAHITNGFRPIYNKDLPANDPMNLNAIKPLTRNEITTTSGTALYDTVYELIAACLVYGMPLYKLGQLGRIVCAIFTDGNDEHSTKHKPDEIKELIEEVRNRERISMMYFGFVTGNANTYYNTAKSMGFEDNEIVLADSITSQLLHDKFGFVSDTLISASQGITITPPQNLAPVATGMPTSVPNTTVSPTPSSFVF